MTPTSRLQAVLEILTSIEDVPRPADAIVSGYFRARRYIGSKDRAAIATMTYDVLRRQARLGWWLDKYRTEVTPRHRMLVYLSVIPQSLGFVSPHGLDAIFSGQKFAPEPLTAEERALLKHMQGHSLEHPDMPDTVKVECPEWAAPALRQRFGDDFIPEMAAMLGTAPLDLRVNTLKTTREQALNELRKAGFAVQECQYSTLGLRLNERVALQNLSLLRDGSLEIQDEGSQLVAELVDAQPGERVVDFCAGAGGKTLAIAAQMKNKGRIIACDVLENRLKRSSERFRRAGVHNIEVKPLENERDAWVKRHKGAFDRVLVDAPCSGTGTWRRNPDQRWKSLGPGLDNLLKLQQDILQSAARLVKPQGRLVYATCSLLPQENEEQINTFLGNSPDFEAMPTRSPTSPTLSLTPYRHNTDGFFGAILTRKGPSVG